MPDFPRIVRAFGNGYLKRMIDPFGRHISYLRVSVTDRCDFRCVYCMAEDMTFLPKAEILTLEELDRACSTFIRLCPCPPSSPCLHARFSSHCQGFRQ